jgi:hypothetical protein
MFLRSARGDTITNYEKVQISILEPKKFSRLCTFKKVLFEGMWMEVSVPNGPDLWSRGCAKNRINNGRKTGFVSQSLVWFQEIKDKSINII